MEQQISTFLDVINLWPTRAAMQRDVEQFQRGGFRANPRDWAHRSRIPVWFFDAVIVAAESRGFRGITYQLLTRFHKEAEGLKGKSNGG